MLPVEAVVDYRYHHSGAAEIAVASEPAPSGWEVCVLPLGAIALARVHEVPLVVEHGVVRCPGAVPAFL